MARLFENISLGNVRLSNRIIIAPMCQYSADEGCATDWHRIHWGQMSHSGAGLFIIEATAVSPEGRISPYDLGLWSSDCELSIGKTLDSVRRYSSMPMIVQLAHAGRKASVHVPWKGGKQASLSEGGWQTIAPSALPFLESDCSPTALDKEGLKKIITSFVESSQRALALDLEGVEIHAAHGYLLHQFLSPLSNHRDDEYGGSLNNRLRFPLEICQAVRDVIPPSKICGLRVSATDWVEGGWSLDQTLIFAEAFKKMGGDYIHVSSGGLSPKQVIPAQAGYQLIFAETIKREISLKTIAVGLITEPHQAESILVSGQADMIGLARAMLYNPRWPWHAAAALGHVVIAPPQFWRSQPPLLKNLFKISKE
jgi:2,4-dienoyl-CoA reductase-like NADH-dependent reductase (Old Yellow Enzyme family)